MMKATLGTGSARNAAMHCCNYEYGHINAELDIMTNDSISQSHSSRNHSAGDESFTVSESAANLCLCALLFSIRNFLNISNEVDAHLIPF